MTRFDRGFLNLRNCHDCLLYRRPIPGSTYGFSPIILGKSSEAFYRVWERAVHHQSWKTFLSGLRGQKVTDCVRRRRWTAVSDAALVVERLEQRALLTDVTPPVVLSATPIDDQG